MSCPRHFQIQVRHISLSNLDWLSIMLEHRGFALMHDCDLDDWLKYETDLKFRIHDCRLTQVCIVCFGALLLSTSFCGRLCTNVIFGKPDVDVSVVASLKAPEKLIGHKDSHYCSHNNSYKSRSACPCRDAPVQELLESTKSTMSIVTAIRKVKNDGVETPEN